jgi:hypothetical protein
MWTKQYTKKKQKYCKPCISLINQEPIMEGFTWSQRDNKTNVDAKSGDFLFDEDEDNYDYEGWDEPEI